MVSVFVSLANLLGGGEQAWITLFTLKSSKVDISREG